MNSSERFNPEHLTTQTLTAEERENIRTRASLRKLQAEMRSQLLVLSQQESNPALDKYQQETMAKLTEEMSGETAFESVHEDPSITVERLEKQGAEVAKLLPNLAALRYATAAKIRQDTGLPYGSTLEIARQFIEQSKSLPKKSPNALLPEAILIGIQTKLAKDLPEVEQSKIITNASEDKSLLADYALVLPEDQRKEFLDSLPEEQRKEVSVFMDTQLAGLLKSGAPLAEGDTRQRANVQERTRREVTDLLEHPDEIADKNLVKSLSRILEELGGEDSKRILAELGQQGLVKHADKEKRRTKISYVARIVREVSEMDKNLGGGLTMKFLAQREVPDRLFAFFCKRLMGSEYITKNTESYLSNPDNLPFLRRLVAAYPNQFNTVIDTISQIKGYEPGEHQDEIFSAIRDLDSLTPIIFDRYRQADADGKRELSEKIRQLKPKFFRNVPIKDILPRQDREILAEMVYLAYKPVGMSFNQVQNFIERLDDHTEDLENYTFPAEGYPFEMSAGKTFKLKAGKNVDAQAVRESRIRLFNRLEGDPEAEKEKLAALLARLVKGGTEFTPDEIRGLLGPMAKDEIIERHAQGLPPMTDQENYTYAELSGLKEILGVYFADNYHRRLENFLSANPSIQQRLMKIWSNPDRRAVILRKLGDDPKQKDQPQLSEKGQMVRLMSRMMGEKVLKATKEKINADLNKFEEATGSGSGKKVGNLKAFVSKNIGSFFAKASAGICTSEDVDLFERSDHFHINIVEDEQNVRGNIQVYVIKDDGQKSLVLRGLNPNTDFLNRISPEEFVDKVFDIARQFVSENKMGKVYLSEALDAWHADSNREPIRQVLRRKYYKDRNKKSYNLKIASSQSISSIYEV